MCILNTGTLSCCHKSLSAILPAIFLFLCLASPATGQETFVRYPLQPPGYSTIKVFDNQGRFVGRILPEKRYWTPIERIPSFLQKAVVAVEDARFYDHGGIDVRGIARAFVKNVVKRRLAEGGSTITQQLIKNRYLSGDKTIERKLEEARLALEFEDKYTKKQILEMYFNEIYYGNGAWGIAQAARLYFDKYPEELTDAECAVLAGVPKNPARYNPLGKSENVAGRIAVVLKRMTELNMITAAQSKMLKTKPASFFKPGQAPQYMAHIRSKLIERHGSDVLEYGGLEVTAALDLDLQKLAEQTLAQGVKRISPELQGALICLDAATGDVLAAVGGADTAQAGYNRAFSAKRQPGSAIKPLIFAAALEKGFTAADRLDDSPVTYDKGNGEAWKPLNYGGERHGELSLREALAYSNNVISVKLLDAIGVSYFADFAGKQGLSLPQENGLSLALGTGEVTLNELVMAYSPFASGGIRAEARTIIRVFDSRRQIWSENPPVVAPVLSPATAFVTTRMLKDVLTYGTAKSLKRFSIEHPSAGKTGTTDDYRDAWFVGYTPQLITGIWAGYDKPKPGGRGFTGGGVAAPIWEKFMRKAVSLRPVADFPQPDTVVSVSIDSKTDLLATPDCPSKQDEYFIAGTEPVEYCSGH